MTLRHRNKILWLTFFGLSKRKLKNTSGSKREVGQGHGWEKASQEWLQKHFPIGNVTDGIGSSKRRFTTRMP